MIRGVLDGSESELPAWVAILEAAKEWGIPPWQVESEASQLWWDRWQAWYEERMKAKAPKKR